MSKKPFSLRSVQVPISNMQKNEKIRLGSILLPKIEKIRFFCERLAEQGESCEQSLQNINGFVLENLVKIYTTLLSLKLYVYMYVYTFFIKNYTTF